MDNGPNFAEFEDRVNKGDITEAEARRMGSTHSAYGWSCTPYGSWSEELCAAYREGWEGANK